MKLLVAMEESETRIIGDEVDLSFLITADHDDVFDNSGSRPARETCQLETVAMEMDGMNVVTRVPHFNSVARALP